MTLPSPLSLLSNPLKTLLNPNPKPIQTRNPQPKLITRRDASLSALSALVLCHVVKVKPALAVDPAISDCEWTAASTGLEFCERVVGKGAPPAQGQLIKAHYEGRLENGKVFDSSYNRGKPLTFRIGVGEVIKGWDQGILGGQGIPPMLPGGKRTLKLPPELAYGARGAGCKGSSCVIPPNSTLIFDVEYIGKI